MIKKVLKGFINGTIGIDIVEIFDRNKDGKVTWKELKSAGVDQWIKFAVSTGTSVISVLFFL